MEETTNRRPSVLGRLRELTPATGLSEDRARRLAERQAQMLFLMLGEQAEVPVPLDALTQIPRIELATVDELPVAGLSFWTGTKWRLEVNGHEPRRRQRFTFAHELKHVLDHPFGDLMYASDAVRERVADHFAACLLMPEHVLVAAWCRDLCAPEDLAVSFDVSTQAMGRRLRYLGLTASRWTRMQKPIRKALQGGPDLAIAGSTPIGDTP